MNVIISAYLDNNIGDDLMIKLLAERFPSWNFYINTNNSTVINTFKNYENIIFKRVNMSRRNLRNYQLFLSIGGSLFNNMNTFMGIIRRIYRIGLLSWLKINNVKLATIGCNLGPYKNKIGPILTNIELKLNNLITVRDSTSYKIIENFLGIKNFIQASDIVFNYSKEVNVNNHSTSNCLGISAYRSISNQHLNYSSYHYLATIADEFIEKTSNSVSLFAFDCENENDLSAAYHIRNISKYPEKITIIPYLGDHHSFIEAFKKCNRFIAVRFHSAILSQILRIPYLPIVYSNKLDNYLDDENYLGLRLKFDNLVIDRNSIKEIVNNIVLNKNIFNEFNRKKSDTYKHFDELEKLICNPNNNRKIYN